MAPYSIWYSVLCCTFKGDLVNINHCSSFVQFLLGTVADNIRYGPQLRGKRLSDNDVFKLLTLADLDASFPKKNGAELSVGQAQRVALARTLANEPEVSFEFPSFDHKTKTWINLRPYCCIFV